MLTAFTRSMDDLFLVAVPFMVVALVVALTMKEKPLAGRAPEPEPEAEPAARRRRARRGAADCPPWHSRGAST